MLKGPYHPRAFLSTTRNIRPGLAARTRLVRFLEKEGRVHTKIVMKEAELTYASTLHHLHLLETENIVARTGKRSYIWELTGAGQQSLIGRKGG